MQQILEFLFCISILLPNFTLQQQCYSEKFRKNKGKIKFLLYDVNLNEGFNLRCDVFIRLAQLIKILNTYEDTWFLILTPWNKLYHWKSYNYEALNWETFFNMVQIKSETPVIELEYFIRDFGNHVDNILYLQYDYTKMGHQNLDYVKEEKCLINTPFLKSFKDLQNFYLVETGRSSQKLYAKNLSCISILATASSVAKYLINSYKEKRVLMLAKAEHILHENYGDKIFWKDLEILKTDNILRHITALELKRKKLIFIIRKSMQFASKLLDLSHNFIKQNLYSQEMDYDTLKVKNIKMIGRDYMGVHWRRMDFITGKDPSKVISIEKATSQIIDIMTQLNIRTLFLATDTVEKEIEDITKIMNNHNKRILIFRNNMTPGELAIVDQIICSLSRYFIGTKDSTFTFRIQEEREIMGFESNTTYNVFCDGITDCHDISKWKYIE